MTESQHESAAFPETSLGDDLPPVQPPSAGFIVQLFLFPALIVMAVVAIWWMFGLIAVGEQDWRKLLQDLPSQNVHIRNRAMYGLAQVLDQDSRRGDQGHQLRLNREIAQGMADQLMIELRKNSSSKEGLAIQEYLTRALGMMDLMDVIAPALHLAMEPTRDLGIRKGAVVSLSFVAGRALERNQQLSSPESVNALVQLSVDALPVLRQSAAFALGLFDSPAAKHQLEVLLNDADPMTRVNAAIGLSRQGSTVGYSVICNSLKLPDAAPIPDSSPERDARLSADADQFLVVKNLLKSVNELAPKFNAHQRQELIPIVTDLSANHPEIRIRVDAAAALNSLKQAVQNN